MPGGGYWYLIYKYRRNQFDPMLRKYLGQTRLEQMPVPMLTVTVDLVEGLPVVRSTGDATRAILESINLPGFSSPIVREGRALVDGGLVNNIPADVLVANGCNFVIASSVTAKLEPQFAGLRSGEPEESQAHRSPSLLEVLMRGQVVQSFNMNSVGVRPADVVIAPDMTSFDLSAFGRADEMADIGYRCALESIESIKSQLSKLDPQLFPA
jgi:predicted acylesterase/phospholipase RssA